MPIDTFVINPKRIYNVAEVDDIIQRMEAYEKERGKKEAVVLLIQNRSLGALYHITSKQEAKKEINKPVLGDTPEFGIKFYNHSYFEELRKRLNGNGTDSNYDLN